MLRAQELSKTLRKVCEDGKEEGLVNILMMDDDGAILGAANPTDTSEEHCSAVLASIYNEYRVLPYKYVEHYLVFIHFKVISFLVLHS